MAILAIGGIGKTGLSFTRRAVLIALSIGASAAIAHTARASLTWNWRYSAPGIAAAGGFATTDDADSNGFYQITAISGARNGARITGLQPTGTPIPGDAPFAVDNLIRASDPQLTKSGFGFATADGNFANPFYADFRAPPAYLEFFSTPPFTSGPGNSEVSVSFTASVPEPGTASVITAALLGLVAARRRRRRTPHGRQGAKLARYRASAESR